MPSTERSSELKVITNIIIINGSKEQKPVVLLSIQNKINRKVIVTSDFKILQPNALLAGGKYTL